MRVLVIDNNILPEFWGAADLARYQSLISGSLFSIRRGPQSDFPKNVRDFDKIIVSGSLTSILDDAPWVGALEELIKDTLNASKPLLGVCYGHQILSRAIFGRMSVRKASISEFGWTALDRTENQSDLFRGLPKRFYSYSSHNDEIYNVPSQCRILARSKDCEIQAFQVQGTRAFGIQFHPEKTLEDGQKNFLERKKRGLGKTYLNPHRGHVLYDPNVGIQIFRNFLTL